MRHERLKVGLTVIELLIVLALLGMLMALLMSFFSAQLRVAGQTQARNEAAVKLRTVAELLVQDLQMAGARAVVDSGGMQTVLSDDICILEPGYEEGGAGEVPPCLEYAQQDSGAMAGLRLFYASSLRTSNPCRQISFETGSSTLRRSDVRCDASSQSLQPVATNVDEVRIEFACGSGERPAGNDPLACYEAGSYPHRAVVTVSGRADLPPHETEATVTLTAMLANLRPESASK